MSFAISNGATRASKLAGSSPPSASHCATSLTAPLLSCDATHCLKNDGIRSNSDAMAASPWFFGAGIVRVTRLRVKSWSRIFCAKFHARSDAYARHFSAIKTLSRERSNHQTETTTDALRDQVGELG